MTVRDLTLNTASSRQMDVDEHLITNAAEPYQAPEPENLSIRDEAIFPKLIPFTDNYKTITTEAYHWEINNWKELDTKVHSPSFQVAGHSWRILLFPRGNNTDECVSVYLEIEKPETSTSKARWYQCARFALVISNPKDPTNYYSHNALHQFSEDVIDWGFTTFYKIRDLRESVGGKGPFVVDNRVVLSVVIRAIDDETGIIARDMTSYDSRKETGYVGLKNQGATCYMNALLQSLYFTSKFRKAIYQIPTETDEPLKSHALALQRCFYNLQHSSTAVDTTELTKSFGWIGHETLMQHDIEELERVMFEVLEEKMKGTPAENSIEKLFRGKFKNFIKCVNVDYESSRVEDFYDIQLDVKGCKTLNDSFQQYIAAETLEGDNQYFAEGHGLQDAKKGIIFESFPPVLHLHLKRFDYDMLNDRVYKINDRFEFPEEIDLSSYTTKPEENKGTLNYVLYGVFVHSGDVDSGHYFALIKPSKDTKWFRFEDETVVRATQDEVFEDSFGGRKTKSMQMANHFTNAYFLVYIRKDRVDEILADVTDNDVPQHLVERQKDEEMRHLFTKVAVVTDSTFTSHQGFDLAVMDEKRLETSNGVDVFKVAKADNLETVKQQLAAEYKIEPSKFRLWKMDYRSEKSLRVDRLLTPEEMKDSIETLQKERRLPSHGFIKFFLETVGAADGKFFEVKRSMPIVMLKYFDIDLQEMRGLGHIYLDEDDRVEDIRCALVERAGLKKGTPITMYREISPSIIECLKEPKLVLKKVAILPGDVICFQKKLGDDQRDVIAVGQEKLLSAYSYYDRLYNTVVVNFKPKEDSAGKEVKLYMDRRTPRDDIATILATHLKEDGDKILLPYGDTLEAMAKLMPKEFYIRVPNIESLGIPEVVFEILPISVGDFKTKRPLVVNILGSKLLRPDTLKILLSKQDTMQVVYDAVCEKIGEKDVSQLRVYEAKHFKISKEFSPEQAVDNIGTDAKVYAERKAADELSMTDDDRLVQVVHYQSDPTLLHSVPFQFVLKKDEPFSETRKRLQERVGLSEMAWKHVKFSLVNNINMVTREVVPLDKDDMVLRSMKITEEDVLALDHIDRSSYTGGYRSNTELRIVR